MLEHIPSHVCSTVLVRLLASVDGCVQSAISFAKARLRLESATLIPTPKSTTTLIGWIVIAFLHYVTMLSTVVAYDCIADLVLLVGVVFHVV